MKPRFRSPRETKYGRRHKPGEMNATEAKYAELLHARQLAGEVIKWEFEGITFKLAHDVRYTPDFSVWLADGSMEFIDTKGSTHRAAVDPKSLVKAKVAAEKFCQFVFAFEMLRPKKDGGGFQRKEF